MPRKRSTRSVKPGRTGLVFTSALAIALLAGCAAPVKHGSAKPQERLAAPPAATPVTPAPVAQAPAPAAQPAPPPAVPADLPPEEARIVAQGEKMSPAERDRLAELIRARALAQTPASQEAAPAVVSPRESTPVPRAARQPLATPAPASRPEANAASGTPRLELSPTDFDFKEVWQGAKAEGAFTIKNAGTAPLRLETRSSCGCTVATKPQSPLAPGATTSFTISYNTSHPGATHKMVTVTTNDPDQLSVVINVHGTVKPLFEATPADRVFFGDLDADSVRSQTIRLVSKYDAPIHLKLRPGLKLDPFAVELREEEPGKVFSLTATTQPPLKPNGNMASAILETDVEGIPTYSVLLIANVPARVTVVPPHLNVDANATQGMEQVVEVRSRGSTPVKITDVKPELASVKWELLPTKTPDTDEKVHVERLRLVVPPFDELPARGSTVQILTDDPDGQFRKLELRIIKVGRPASAPAKR